METKTDYLPAQEDMILSCDVCGKPGSARQRFIHQGVRLCYLCTVLKACQLATEGHEIDCACQACAFLFVAYGNRSQEN